MPNYYQIATTKLWCVERTMWYINKTCDTLCSNSNTVTHTHTHNDQRAKKSSFNFGVMLNVLGRTVVLNGHAVWPMDKMWHQLWEKSWAYRGITIAWKSKHWNCMQKLCTFVRKTRRRKRDWVGETNTCHMYISYIDLTLLRLNVEIIVVIIRRHWR